MGGTPSPKKGRVQNSAEKVLLQALGIGKIDFLDKGY